MTDDELLETLRKLETELHVEAARRDRTRMERLLHPDFEEFGSLWVPIAVHFLNNSFYNFVHIRTDLGLDENVAIMQVVATVGLVALVPLLRAVAR